MAGVRSDGDFKVLVMVGGEWRVAQTQVSRFGLWQVAWASVSGFG